MLKQPIKMKMISAKKKNKKPEVPLCAVKTRQKSQVGFRRYISAYQVQARLDINIPIKNPV